MTLHKKTIEEFNDMFKTMQEDVALSHHLSGGYFNDIKDFISKNFIDKHIMEEELNKAENITRNDGSVNHCAEERINGRQALKHTLSHTIKW